MDREINPLRSILLGNADVAVARLGTLRSKDPKEAEMILGNSWGTITKRGIVVLTLLMLGSGSVNGQIFYNIFDPNVGERLVQLNADGSAGIFQVGNLPQAADPTFSNDGRFLAVRAGLPNQFSSNVHVFDRITGNLQQVTNLADSTDPMTGNTTNETPRYTAFSPDGSLLFVMSFLNVASNNQGGGTTIFTRVYRLSDGEIIAGPDPVAMTDALSTVGRGASWSVSSNLIAIPAPNIKTKVGTAIFGGNEFANLPIRQLTFPKSGSFGNPFDLTIFTDNDLFPSFSPNGQSLAYFRTRSQSRNGVAQPSPLALRISDAAGDRLVFQFNPGFFPTGLSWTSDGSQLVFGLAQQSVGNGVFPLREEFGTSEIVTVNVDGTGIGQLVPPFAFKPTVAPELGPVNTFNVGDVNQDGAVNFLDINPFIGALSGGGFRDEADINRDGEVNFLDIAPFIAILAGG